MAEPTSNTPPPPSPSHPAHSAVSEPKFEVLLAELEKLVGDLEGGKLSMEDSLSAFERGMKVSGQAAAILDQADLRIEQLTGSGENAKTTAFTGG
jgi:exodeoxyribonuclease VII small subunit